MFRRSPRSVLLWSAAAATAFLTAVSVAGSLSSLRRQAQAFGHLRTVVVASRDLALGATVRSADLAVRRVRGEPPAGGGLTRPSDAVGRVVAVPVLRGSPVTARHLAARGRTAPGAVVPPRHRAMRFVTEGGIEPAPGDTVDVYATFDPSAGMALPPGGSAADGVGTVEPAATVAGGVTVLAAETIDGGRTAVTVLVREGDARRLAYASATGILAVAVGPPEEARASH